MPKLTAQLVIELTPEQSEQAEKLFDAMDEKGGLLLGSLYRYRSGSPDFEIKDKCGFRLVDLPTALKIIELANREENENGEN